MSVSGVTPPPYFHLSESPLLESPGSASVLPNLSADDATEKLEPRELQQRVRFHRASPTLQVESAWRNFANAELRSLKSRLRIICDRDVSLARLDPADYEWAMWYRPLESTEMN